MKQFLLALAVASLPAQASLIFIVQGNNASYNTADVVFDYIPIDSVSGTIDIDITNTSTIGVPMVTGFFFNTPSAVTGVSSFVAPSNWSYTFDPNNVNSPMPLGLFDIGTDTKTTNDGIAVGLTSSFQFVVTGTSMNLLTASSFLSEFSFQKQGGPGQYFAVRFQRTDLDGEGSDVGIPTGRPLPPNVIPEPGTLTLLLSGVGLIAMGTLFRRRRSS